MEEDFSNNDLADIFGKSKDEDNFASFSYTLLDDINQQSDDDKAKFRSFFNDNPCTLKLNTGRCWLVQLKIRDSNY